MALSEQKILKQVTLLPEQNVIQVQWANQVLRDDEVIAETFHRRAYSSSEQEAFEVEVENSAVYVSAIGWAVV
jgi:hypothetical protein